MGDEADHSCMYLVDTLRSRWHLLYLLTSCFICTLHYITITVHTSCRSACNNHCTVVCVTTSLYAHSDGKPALVRPDPSRREDLTGAELQLTAFRFVIVSFKHINHNFILRKDHTIVPALALQRRQLRFSSSFFFSLITKIFN